MNYSPDELFKLIKNRKEPIAVTRCGDGEARILNRDYDMVLTRQLGYLPNEEQCEEIRQNLITAYASADIIGIPQNKRAGLSDYWYRCEEILYANCPEAECKDKTNVDYAYDWLRDELFTKLLLGRDCLNYISSRDLNKEFIREFVIGQIFRYLIPPEAKFSYESASQRHYPDVFNHLKEHIKIMPAGGNLCLIGAGVIGKIYCSWFKQAGGIALDIGGVFDLWSGLCTRGANKGVGVIDNTYKL